MGIESIDKVLLKVLKAKKCSLTQIFQMHCTCVRTQIKIQRVKGLLVSWDKVLLKVLICRTKMNVLVWRTETKRGRFHSYANTNANSNTE